MTDIFPPIKSPPTGGLYVPCLFYKSRVYIAYHKGRPFNENHLRVCPLLDNPDALVNMVEDSVALSTDLQDPEDVRELSEKCHDVADKWAVMADGLWECSGHCTSCGAVACHIILTAGRT